MQNVILQCFSAENLYVVKVVQRLCIQNALAFFMSCKPRPCERHPNQGWTLNQAHLLWLFKEQFALADALWSPLVLIDLCPPGAFNPYPCLFLLICYRWLFSFLILTIFIPVLTDLCWMMLTLFYPHNVHPCPYKSVLGDPVVSSWCLQISLGWSGNLAIHPLLFHTAMAEPKYDVNKCLVCSLFDVIFFRTIISLNT